MIGVEGDELARAGRLHQGIRADLAGLCDEQVGELVGVVEDPYAPLAKDRGARRGNDVVPRDLRLTLSQGRGEHEDTVERRSRQERKGVGGGTGQPGGDGRGGRGRWGELS